MHTKELKGNGRPLLMLHGWGQSLQALLPLAELLVPHATPFLIDLPGFGQSKPPDEVWSAFDYADQIVQHLEQKGIKKFFLLGHSFGGKVSLCIALRYPEKVEKMILIAPSGLKPKRTLIAQLKLKTIILSGKWLKRYDKLFGTAHFAKSFAPKFGSRDYNNSGNMRGVLVKSVNEDLSEQLPKIRCPTLVLWGEKDSETPLEAGHRFAKLIPQAKFYAFPHHDHELFKDVGAHLCATYIAPFMAKDAS